ncbi:hypothetical protein V9T40_010531 [Parthenolecanium corni]|uniref:Zinc finger protein-like 1 homolog n=1 Tax=Parthenolecanium corni TaxID=536013 RepID=A0AAN9XYN6_9HEMI
MGLCKCPKRVVTNQFCYEHKVNVCEHCMITNHPKCIVLSYLKWLQDGDYNPVCELCSKNLTDEECVRLVCYHVFHWTCITHYAKQLSPTTTSCPSCNSSIFPSANLVSPVADVLRKKFETVNWARLGLGLPKLTEEVAVKEETSSQELTYYGGTECTSPQQHKFKETVVHIDEPVGGIRVLVLEKLGSEVPIVDDPLLNPNIRVNDANS